MTQLNLTRNDVFFEKKGVSINWSALKVTFVFAALSLNALVKLSPVLYALLIAPAIGLIFLDLFRIRFPFSKESIFGGILFLLYVFFVFVAVVNSANTISVAGTIIGASRFLFALPLLVAFLLYVRNFDALRTSLVGMAIVLAIGNLSVPWQMAFGEITWLEASYTRGGFNRYASILGNVTAIGISAGFYFAISLFVMRKGFFQSLIAIAIIITSIASLSKAAIFNIAIPVIVVIFMGIIPRLRIIQKIPFKSVIGGLMLVGVVISIAMSVPAIQGRLLVSLASFGVESQGTRVDDVDIGTSFEERLLYHPTEIFYNLDRLRGPWGLLTGAGFGMSSTALVPQEDQQSIMSHNQLVEFWALSGVFFLLLFIVIIISVFIMIFSLINECWRTNRNEERRVFVCLLSILICYVANLPFANGLVYQPTQAAIFWMFFALLLLPRRLLLLRA